MRLAPTLLVSSLSVAGLLAPAYAGTVYQNHDGAHAQGRSSLTAAATLAKRQYKAPRALIDACVAVNADVFASIAGTLLPPNALNLEVCLCLNDLNLWVRASVAGRLLDSLLGRVKLLAALNTVLASKASEECTFPPKARRICVQDDPCAFECEDGYSNVDGECVCQEPYSECNGICGNFDTCGSAVPRRRRSVQKITSLAQAKKTCKSKESVCGIAGREGTLDFECVDTSATLDSCGGCVVPHPFYEPHRSTALGIECGRLPGALTATCSNSACVVAKCRNGYQPSADGTHCVVPDVLQEAFSVSGVGPLRLDFGKRGTVTDAVITNADLRSKLSVVADAVIAVNEVCHRIRHPRTTPAVDYPALVQGTVDATVQLLNSHTVLQVLANVDALVASNADFKRRINECGCTRWLSLGDLVAQLDAFIHIVLELQAWLKTNPVATLPGANPLPVPSTSDLVIDLNLDAVLGRIAKSVAAVNVNLDIAAPIISKVTGLVQLVLKLGKAGANLPVGSSPIVIPIVGDRVLPVDTALVDAVVQAAINLGNSTTVPALVANLQALLDVNALVSSTLNKEKRDLGALTLANEAVGKAALELKATLKLATNLTGTIDLKLGAIVNDLRGLLHNNANLSVLQGKISAIVKLVLGLGQEAQTLPVVGIINTHLLDSVVKATVSLLGSTSVPLLLANVEVLLKANIAIDALLNKCGCVQLLNLGGLQGVVKAVITALIDVKTWATENNVIPAAGPFIPNATALANQLRASV